MYTERWGNALGRQLSVGHYLHTIHTYLHTDQKAVWGRRLSMSVCWPLSPSLKPNVASNKLSLLLAPKTKYC